MLPSPAPLPGLYRDSCGTVYRATHDRRSGWWLEKMALKLRPLHAWPGPFQRPDFEAAVCAGLFIPVQ